MKKFIAILLLMIIPATASATPGTSPGRVGPATSTVSPSSQYASFGKGDMKGLTAFIAIAAAAAFVGGVSLAISLSIKDKDPNDPLTRRDNFRKEIKDNSSWMPALNIGPTEDGVYGSMEWEF